MTLASPVPQILVADIGGTNTRVALSHGTQLLDTSVRRYKNAERSGLEEILTTYLEETGATPSMACVAGAGPVMDGDLTMTNLSWHITRDSIARATGAGFVAILNDLQAQGHALDHLSDDDLVPLLNWEARKHRPHDAKLAVGLGTGMNIAMVFRTGGLTVVPPSETGHSSLPMCSEEDFRFGAFLEAKGLYPSIEEALSGRGIEQLYAFHARENGSDKTLGAAEVMAAVPTGDPIATATARSYVTYAGRVAGDLALIQMPRGGIYLIGGVARAFGPYFQELGLAAAFRDKGRFAKFTDQFPVCIVEDDYAALRGCAAHILELTGA